MTQAELINALERFVDSEGLYSVTEALSLVCIEKAEHLQINWQDNGAAKRWMMAHTAFKKAHARLEEIQFPC